MRPAATAFLGFTISGRFRAPLLGIEQSHAAARIKARFMRQRFRPCNLAPGEGFALDTSEVASFGGGADVVIEDERLIWHVATADQTRFAADGVPSTQVPAVMQA